MCVSADDNFAEPIVDKSDDVVIWLTSSLFDLGYHIYTDNYYTSVPLAMYLYSPRSLSNESLQRKAIL